MKDRRIKRALERDLAEFRREHPETLERIGHGLLSAPACDQRAHRVAEAEDMRDIRTLEPVENPRNARSDAEPSEPCGRCRANDPRAVEHRRRCPPFAGSAELDEGRRDDVDGMASGHE